MSRGKPRKSEIESGVARMVHAKRYDSRYEEVEYKLVEDGRLVPEAWEASDKEFATPRPYGIALIHAIAGRAAARLRERELPDVPYLIYPVGAPGEWKSHDECQRQGILTQDESGRVKSRDGRAWRPCAITGYMKDRGYNPLSDEMLCAEILFKAHLLEHEDSENIRLHLALEIGVKWQMLRSFMAADRPRHAGGEQRRGKHKVSPKELQEELEEMRANRPSISLTHARRIVAKTCDVSYSTVKRYTSG